METEMFPNVSRDRQFLTDLQGRSNQYISEIKMFLHMVRKRVKIERSYHEQMSQLIPTELMHKDCLIKCMAMPLIDSIQRKINEKEVFLEAVNQEEFIQLNEDIKHAETEIAHLHRRSSQYISELNKIESMITSGQKRYWTVAKEMEESIHNFVMLPDKVGNRERKQFAKEMQLKYISSSFYGVLELMKRNRWRKYTRRK